jgi:hypothetical protein
MKKSRLLLSVLALGAFALPSPATFAQSQPDAPKRAHCVAKKDKDGKQVVLAAADRKECKQAGGKWRRVKPEGDKS